MLDYNVLNCATVVIAVINSLEIKDNIILIVNSMTKSLCNEIK